MIRKKGLILIFTLTTLFACQKQHLNNEFCDCAGTPTTQVIDTTTLTIPNIITPNADGYNDVWVINHISYFPDCNVKIIKPGIFPKTVYESTGYSTDFWDGEGKNGKYKYEITIGDKKISGYVCVYKGEKNPTSTSIPDEYDCLDDCVATDSNDPFVGP